MTPNKALKPRIFLENTPTVERLVPELATAIGLNESIMLLQLDFWIGQSDNYRDGSWWTYQSTREMQAKAFPYWGIGTIQRTVVSLEKQELVITGNYNKRPHDNTRWFALNPVGMKALSKKCPSVQFFVPEPEAEKVESDYTQGLEQGRNGVGTTRSKMEQPVPEWNDPFQNGTTLPETPTENTQKEEPKDSAPKNGAPIDVQATDEVLRVVSAEKLSSEIAPSPSKTSSAPTDDEVKAFIAAWLQNLTAPPATNQYGRVGNRNAAKGLIKRGYTHEQMARFMAALYTQPFWQGKVIPLTHIADHMPAWLESAKKPAAPTNGVPPAPTTRAASPGAPNLRNSESRERERKAAVG